MILFGNWPDNVILLKAVKLLFCDSIFWILGRSWVNLIVDRVWLRIFVELVRFGVLVLCQLRNLF